ncbi:MAG: hypothetical protein US75_C0010G0055 [Candidatus Woesebacteria bacterium GW2011_GWC1_38_13]|uniref:Uncharacterized protein n=3 Tax=Candidatus Woeseibacteriota TaxID=1752722 RepID=A0A0G0NEM5_9BACT|nr:MAG: hypothetical protein US67_C0060G0010 [Candidatus Woesebacteria bacterium GW2011_GWD1_38_10]KKQ56109.1 MAG: hypothetical protein US75_C0010G0055 [Candidatus Woesebacteria bacterium GW2011_GWC1_38_13]KKQ75178.1 MAG: hypothetical protein US97_C0046G0011 [Microgenomates group bacterium GW2011_GWF1_38_5]KKQ84349.1 MAG: hypothetical protein UT06_C0005G0008 [Candidatus Woesebacteria bacterium GW2011_GWA1_38_8]
MKKYTLFTVILSVILVFPKLVNAQGVQQQDRVQDPTMDVSITPNADENQVQNQNQYAVQNQGVETQLMSANQQMQKLMDMDGLGEDVRFRLGTLAQAHLQTQSQIQQEVNKLNSRSRATRLFAGTDLGAVKNMKAQLEQNRVRVQQLNELKNQLANEGELTMLQETIQAMNLENTALQERITAEDQQKSLFGWLFRLFAN